MEKKKERKHFLNEGEKERKEGGDKEIRKNVCGGRRKKKKNQREQAGEDEGRMRVLERVWRKRKRRGGDRDNVCGGGDSIGKKKQKNKNKNKNKNVWL